MGVPTTAWDETKPAGSRSIKLGDNDIREMKTQIREVVSVDHEWISTQTLDTGGQHKQVTLQEQADLGTGATGVPILGAQTVSDKPELMYTNEDDEDVQITSGTTLAFSATANKTALMNLIYPVGIVVTLGVSTNPNTLFGVGTWSAIAGKVIVGINAGDAEFDTLDETGGAKTHTLSTDEMPAHTHNYTLRTQTNNGQIEPTGGDGDAVATPTSSAGGGQAHNNLQPYIVKYVWQRAS